MEGAGFSEGGSRPSSELKRATSIHIARLMLCKQGYTNSSTVQKPHCKLPAALWGGRRHEVGCRVMGRRPAVSGRSREWPVASGLAAGPGFHPKLLPQMREPLRVHGPAVLQELAQRFQTGFREEGRLPPHRIGPDLDQTAVEHTLDGFRDFRLALVWASAPGAQEQAVRQLGLL